MEYFTKSLASDFQVRCADFGAYYTLVLSKFKKRNNDFSTKDCTKQLKEYNS